MRNSLPLVVLGLALVTGASTAYASDPYYCSVINASLNGRVPKASPSLKGPGLPTINGQASPSIHKLTDFFPYYGKNNIHYDTFNWQVYETEHFTIYYYDDVGNHLARISGYAESAYQQVSADLRHDLPGKVPLIMFKTHSEFEQQNVFPGEAQDGVAAFAESDRRRMLMPIDEAPDRLYGLIVHELTHIFDYDFIPQGLIRQSTPLWMHEGLADYERAQWEPMDLMTIRDAAVSDIIPRMSRLEGYGSFSNPRVIYNLGHAVFEFIEERFGKEGVRGFLLALRKSVIGGGEDAYQEAFQMSSEEFDVSFERYMKDRFKAFRDKERPTDYGRNLAPNSERTPYTSALSIAPSPSGELMAAVTGNRKDAEVDIVLLSTKDGSVVNNLTSGFDKDMGYSYIVQIGERFNTVPWMAWSSKGDELAYFVRTEKERALIVQNIITKEVLHKIPLREVDEPESPSFSPDGKIIAFSALKAGLSDIYTVDLATKKVTNLTSDELFDYGPTYSPDGTFLVYMVRVSGNYKLFRFDFDTKKRTQLTFAPQDESAVQFINKDTIVFSSTGADPGKPLEPEVAKNANVYNIWTLGLQSGELKQYTDLVGGAFSPIVLQATGSTAARLAFVTYDKGEWGVRALERKDAVATAASADFGAPGPIIDFQSPLSHTLIQANTRPKKMFEKMAIEGVPALNLMVSSNGDVFGGTAISFGDVLGDQRFLVYADSGAQYSMASRTLMFQWINMAHRFQFALQGLSTTQYFYTATNGVFLDPSLAPLFDRTDLQATSQSRGGTGFLVWPMSRFRRVEVSTGFFHVKEEYNQGARDFLDSNNIAQPAAFRNGWSMPFGVAYTQETTVFREFGPLSGSTARISYEVEPPIGDLLSSRSLDMDGRYYQRIGTSGVLALRLNGFFAQGQAPRYNYFGGNSEMRGYDYLEFSGQNTLFANAELRFPLIEAALTPIGVVGGIRGVFFFNIGRGWFSGDNTKLFTSGPEPYTPVVDYERDLFGNVITGSDGNPIPILGAETVIDGFRLRDARASYGFGVETFLFGFPLHFDWAWRTTFNREWEDALFASAGGSDGFRHMRFGIWIGYDF